MVAKVVHQDDLLKKMGGSAIDDAGDSTKQGSVCLIVEDDHH